MMNSTLLKLLVGAVLLSLENAVLPVAFGQAFQLPTSNRAIFESGQEEKYYVGTVGKPWTSGTFGCVRSQGQQLHEGIDIKCLRRDSRGEPLDPVMAAAAGSVAYINTKSALSNYGVYVILKHRIDGLEVYTLYSHLKEPRAGLKVGQSVAAGETIGIMGRTANTREGISQERAHLHFEINLLVNDRFPAWYKKNYPNQRNDHGLWNGQNMLGLDPRLILLGQRAQGDRFSLREFIQKQTVLCRVLVRDTQFPWLQRYPALVRGNPVAAKEGVAGYEIALNYCAVPVEVVPRAASEIKGKAKIQVLAVNEAEQKRNPCRRLVVRQGQRWALSNAGLRFIDLLTF